MFREILELDFKVVVVLAGDVVVVVAVVVVVVVVVVVSSVVEVLSNASFSVEFSRYLG